MIPQFLLQKEDVKLSARSAEQKLSFIDRTIKNVANFISNSFMQWHSSNKNGLLQSIDSRVKVVLLFCIIILISLLRYANVQIIISSVLFLLIILSRLNVFNFYKRILVIGFLFGFLIFLPSSLNLFNKGNTFITIVKFTTSHQWWIYKLPLEISITYEGIRNVLQLTLKVVNSVTAVMLIISTTNFERVIKSLSFFKIPNIFLLTLTLSYKMIFILSQTIEDTYKALKMRWWNKGPVIHAEEIVAGRIGYIFRKSWERYELTYQAMCARGFNGSVNFHYFEKFKTRDLVFSFICILFMVCIIIFNFMYAGNI